MTKTNYLIIFIFIITVKSIFAQDYYLWELALPGKVISKPVERKNGELILICEDRRVYSIDMKLGRINWKVKPGGKLEELHISPDGSIIISGRNSIYSLFNDGSLRWKFEVNSPIDSNISINSKGDILFISNSQIYKLDRFGISEVVINNINSNMIKSTSNSLILFKESESLRSITYSGNRAWELSFEREISLVETIKDGFFVIFRDGVVEEYNNRGFLLKTYTTENQNPYECYMNFQNKLVVKGDKGIFLKDIDGFIHNNEELNGLYYSSGLIITSGDDWVIRCRDGRADIKYYPSGEIQIRDANISLSDKRVWNDEKYKAYYQDIIVGGDREHQKELLSGIEDVLKNKDLLDLYPNFYDILLTGSSKLNKNRDIRKEAYRLIGFSKDISFLPYLLNDLLNENSYSIISYIYFALGQLGIDSTGEVVEIISSTLDDYYDETMVINGLYALFYINNYTNNEYVDVVFKGIEKILNGGYSRKIENRCYEILKSIK